ncbi:MAG: acyltransferase, partial [Fimbriimonas ginsengisoli]|nr:acyltransferase [Fimbriimonas ginsengisoli]
SSIPLTRAELVGFATFTVNFLKSNLVVVPRTISPLWSVSIEEQFYACWPWVIRFTNRRALAAVALSMIVIGWLFRMSLVGAPDNMNRIWYHSLTHLDCFAFGCLAALFLRGRELGSAWMKGGMMLAAFGGIFLLERLFQFKAPDGGHDDVAGVTSYVFIAALCALIVWLASTMKQGLLTGRAMVGIGAISYGLYGFHRLVLTILEHELPGSANWPWRAGLTILVTFTLAVLSFRFYEKPLLRLRRRFQAISSGRF